MHKLFLKPNRCHKDYFNFQFKHTQYWFITLFSSSHSYSILFYFIKSNVYLFLDKFVLANFVGQVSPFDFLDSILRHSFLLFDSIFSVSSLLFVFSQRWRAEQNVTIYRICSSLLNPLKLWFFALTQKIFRQPIPENPWLFSNFLLRMPLWKKSKNLVLPPLRELLGHTVQN